MLINRIKNSVRASLFKTFIVALRTGSWCIRVFPNMHISLAPSASVLGNGTLSLGLKWDGLRYFPSEFKLGERSCLTVNGAFAIYTGCHISVADDAKLTLGKGYINNDVCIDCFDEISIGHGVVISKGVTIRDSDNHRINDSENITAPVFIEDNVWVGLNVTILKGVRIGTGAVIAAGSVVTKDVASGTLVGGVPTKVLKQEVVWS